jgi:Putative Ig domain/Galactose oxidase, central domain
VRHGAGHWSVSAGALPPGLTLNTAGAVISGTPTKAGTYNLTLKVTDNANQSATHAYTIMVTPPPPLVGPQPLPGATSGQAYSDTLTATSGTPPYQWSVSSGTLPSGLTLGSGTGTISGTPTASGLSAFTVTVTDHAGGAASRGFTIMTLPPPPQIGTASLTGGVVGQSYAASLSATGGATSLTWSVTGGALPAGLSLTAGSGVVTGTPSAVGNPNVTFTVTDADGRTSSQQLSLAVVDPTFLQESPASVPAARYGASMAYDPSSQQLILFGGHISNTDTGDTWEWTGTNWTQLSPMTSPGGRYQANLVYDPTLGELVLFGGYRNGTYLNDTWAWNGTTWALINTAHSPVTREAAAMAYDPALSEIVLFGGLNSSAAVLNDTWTFNGTDWTSVSPTTPPAAAQNARLAFDPSSNQLILFGGINADGTATFGTTYTYDGTAWTALNPSASPTARWGESLAYDQATSELVLFGGAPNFGVPNDDDAWTWNGSTWTQVTPVPATPASAFPAARSDAPMDYDAATGQMVMSGGLGNGGSPPWVSDTWIYLGP